MKRRRFRPRPRNDDPRSPGMVVGRIALFLGLISVAAALVAHTQVQDHAFGAIGWFTWLLVYPLAFIADWMGGVVWSKRAYILFWIGFAALFSLPVLLH